MGRLPHNQVIWMFAMNFKTCCFTSQRGIIDLLPDVRALYLISNQGRLQYIGMTSNLNHRIYKHNWSRTVLITRTSIVHWLEGCTDKALERHLTLKLVPPCNFGRQGNKDKVIPVWDAIDFIQDEYERYYLRLIDNWAELMPDDDDAAAVRIFDRIVGYWRILAHHDKSYQPQLEYWQRSQRFLHRLSRDRAAA
ncbi:MAG: hypothetical protein C6Y22_29960 [Hapalosiphonaceae cyanobacterium JJU2]|nr:MAG: hypothetical protein C6Y22_29960 [Hapalosiphonaceae cyanobacterium JJU2]